MKAKQTMLWAAMAAVVFSLASCSDQPEQGAAGAGNEFVESVSGYDHFQEIVHADKERLVLFDFYADWCSPCKQLAPTIADLAKKYRDRISVYQVDVDVHQDLAMDVGAQGIPFILFVRDGKAVHSMTGLQPREEYIRAVERYSKPPDNASGETTSG